MPILNITISQAGLVDVVPSQAYINTNDPISAVITTGYLNKEVMSGVIFTLPCLAIVSTQETPTSMQVVGVYNVVHAGQNWSLTNTSDNSDIPLTNGQIFVGNASNIATPQTLNGALSINNTGVATLTPNAISFNQINETLEAQNIVTATSAQINAMYTTPIQLVPAQGANTLIVLDEIVWDINFATTQFTGGGVIAAQYSNAAQGAGPAASTTIAASTLNGIAASSFLYMGPTTGLNAQKIFTENEGIYLSNATAVFATGNSQVIFYVRYHLLTAV